MLPGPTPSPCRLAATVVLPLRADDSLKHCCAEITSSFSLHTRSTSFWLWSSCLKTQKDSQMCHCRHKRFKNQNLQKHEGSMRLAMSQCPHGLSPYVTLRPWFHSFFSDRCSELVPASQSRIFFLSAGGESTTCLPGPEVRERVVTIPLGKSQEILPCLPASIKREFGLFSFQVMQQELHDKALQIMVFVLYFVLFSNCS